MRHQGAVLTAFVALAVAAGAPTAQSQSRPARASATSDANPPAPPYTRDSFAFAGPVPKRAELQVAEHSSVRTGDLYLRLRNRTRLSGPLHLRYFSRGAGTIELLGDKPAGPKAPVSVVGARSGGVDVGGHDVAGIQLRLRVDGGRPARALDGLLVAQMRTRGRFGPVARVRIRALGPVTFAPAKIHLHTQRDCIKPLKCDQTAEVAIRGDGARALLAEQGAIGAARLDEDDSDGVRVVLGHPEERHGVVWSTLKIDHFEGTGHFTGDVPLTSGSDGERLAVDISVRRPFVYAVLAVLIGSLLAALGARWTGVRRRASIARLELLTALGEYDAQRKADGDNAPASFPLDRWIEPRGGKNGRVRARPGTRGVGALMWDLQKARTQKDVDTDIPRAQALSSRISRWLTVEPAARRASELLDRSFADRRCGGFDTAERYLADLELLLGRTRSPAGDSVNVSDIDENAADLAARVADQVELTAVAAQVWSILRRLEQRDVPPADYQRHLLDSVRGRELEAEQRTPEQTEALRRDLYRRRDALRALCTKHNVPDDLQDVARPETADGRAPALKAIPVSGRRWLKVAFSWVEVKDWAWTLIRAGVTAVVYVEAFYDPAWGSTDELIGAFTAGFTQETLINWLNLPAFQSLRSRNTTPPPDVSGRGPDAPGSSPDPSQGQTSEPPKEPAAAGSPAR